MTLGCDLELDSIYAFNKKMKRLVKANNTKSQEVVMSEGFNQLVIQKVVDGTASEYETIDINNPNYVDGSNSFTYNLNYVLSVGDVGKTLSFKAIISDTSNNNASLDFAEAEVKQSLQFVESLFLQTKLPVEPFNTSVDHFLYINGDTVENATLGSAVTNQLNEKQNLYIMNIDRNDIDQLISEFETSKFNLLWEVFSQAQNFLRTSFYDNHLYLLNLTILRAFTKLNISNEIVKPKSPSINSQSNNQPQRTQIIKNESSDINNSRERIIKNQNILKQEQNQKLRSSNIDDNFTNTDNSDNLYSEKNLNQKSLILARVYKHQLQLLLIAP